MEVTLALDNKEYKRIARGHPKKAFKRVVTILDHLGYEDTLEDWRKRLERRYGYGKKETRRV